MYVYYTDLQLFYERLIIVRVTVLCAYTTVLLLPPPLPPPRHPSKKNSVLHLGCITNFLDYQINYYEV